MNCDKTSYLIILMLQEFRFQVDKQVGMYTNSNNSENIGRYLLLSVHR